MVELEPWRPFREAVSLRDAMDRLFEDSVITPSKISGGLPRIDLKETKDSVVVKAELPGVAEDDISVEVLDNVMTISGEKKEEKEVRAVVDKLMRNAMKLNVPLVVEIGVGKNWLEAH